jgi:L-ascorbate metabolism protein UlaG (beta-lactamase superfamily)
MLTIHYIGHSAFALEADGIQVLIDPFITGNPTAKANASDFSPKAILITHAHNDHVGDAIEIAKRTGAAVISTFELGELLESKGVPNAVPANHGGTVRFEGGSTKLVPAWHTSTYTEPDGSLSAPGIPAGHVVRFGGKTLYFAGDTCLFGDMRLIGEEGLDIAVLPIGDLYTMGPDDACRAVAFLEPRLVIPCHYNTFPPIRQDPQAFKAKVESRTSAECRVLMPDERTMLD